MSEDWKIYGIFDNSSGECIYIGRTSMSLKNRWFYHTWKDNKSHSPIWRHMQEHGIDNFHIDLVMLCDTRDEWWEWEEHLILELEPKFNKRLPGTYT